MRGVSAFTAAALAAGLCATPLAAQTPAGHREVQVRMMETQRRLLLAMVDSMPERLYRDKATPAQRDFAGQVHHAANSVAFIVNRVLGGGMPAGLPDTAATFTTRAGMRRFVTGVYDHAIGVLRQETEAQRTGQVNLFGQAMPRWQVWDEINQHTLWTAGQIVANFRKHGMAPPGFGFF